MRENLIVAAIVFVAVVLFLAVIAESIPERPDMPPIEIQHAAGHFVRIYGRIAAVRKTHRDGTAFTESGHEFIIPEDQWDRFNEQLQARRKAEER